MYNEQRSARVPCKIERCKNKRQDGSCALDGITKDVPYAVWEAREGKQEHLMILIDELDHMVQECSS